MSFGGAAFGASGFGSEPVVIIEEDSVSMAGDSSSAFDGSLILTAAVSISGDSTTTFDATVIAAGSNLAIVGGSTLFIDPTKVTVINKSPTRVVVSAGKPAAVPEIRITPPGLTQAKLSVGTPLGPIDRNKRKEG